MILGGGGGTTGGLAGFGLLLMLCTMGFIILSLAGATANQNKKLRYKQCFTLKKVWNNFVLHHC